MELISRFNRAVYAQVLLGLFAYGVAKQDPLTAALAPAFGLLSWFVVERGSGWSVPRSVIRLGVTATVAWCLYAQVIERQPPVVTIGAGVMALQLMILFQRKRTRDYGQLIILSMMQMLVAMIMGASLAFGGLLALYMIASLLAVLRYQLRRGHDEVAAELRRQGVLGAEDAVLATPHGRSDRGAFARTAAASGAATAFMAAGFFIALPRGEAGMLGRYEMQRVSISGFTDEVRLNAPGRILESDEIVMTVSLSRDGQPVGGPGGGFYLRGAVLDHYDPEAQRWVRSDEFDDDQDSATRRRKFGYLPPSEASDGAPLLEQRITMRASPPRGLLFAAFAADAVRVPGGIHVRIRPGDHTVRIDTGGRPLPDGFEYTVWSHVGPGVATSQGAVGESFSQWPFDGHGRAVADRFFLRPLSAGTDTIRRHAEGIFARAGVPLPPAPQDPDWVAAAARAVETHFHANYHYSLDVVSPADGLDPVVDFLTNRDTGHCEYFASAVTALLRSVGVPARVVTGYRVEEWSGGGHYVVRQRNAHAWVEAWLPPRGWVTLDGSPPAELAAVHAAGGALTWLRDRYQDLEFRWVRNVISYDSEDRRALVGNLDSRFSRFLAGSRFAAASLFGWTGAGPGGGRAYLWLIASGLVCILLVATSNFSRKRKRRRILRKALRLDSLSRAERRRLLRELGFFGRALELLARAGHPKPLHEPAGRFAQRLIGLDPARFAAMTGLVRVYYEVRFGGMALAGPRADAARQGIEQLRRSL